MKEKKRKKVGIVLIAIIVLCIIGIIASPSDDKKDVTVEELLPYGINALDTEFEVVKANGKELILKSDYATLMLKRF